MASELTNTIVKVHRRVMHDFKGAMMDNGDKAGKETNLQDALEESMKLYIDKYRNTSETDLKRN